MRSFSNLWFWIALAVIWSTASHWIMGVPYDTLQRAQAGHTQAQADVTALAHIYSRRVVYIADASGLWITGFATFILTMCAGAGFVYGVEFCQAIFLLGVPMVIVAVISLRSARKLLLTTEGALFAVLRRHRLYVQLTGFAAILVTSMWGMWVNMNANVLGG